MQERREIQFVAANFSHLQGLRSVPVSLVLLLVILWANQQSGPRRDLLLPIMIFLAGAFLFWLIDRYYKSRYGWVKPKRRELVIEWIIGLLFGILALGAFILDTGFRIPISLIGLVFSAGMLGDYFRMTWFVKGRYLPFYPIFAVLILVVSILPLFGLDGWWLALGIGNQFSGVLLITSGVLMLAGIFTHFYLTSLLPAMRR